MAKSYLPHNPGQGSLFIHSFMLLLTENVFIQNLCMPGTGLGITMSNIQTYRERKRESLPPKPTEQLRGRSGSDLLALLCQIGAGVSSPDIPQGRAGP